MTALRSDFHVAKVQSSTDRSELIMRCEIGRGFAKYLIEALRGALGIT